MNFKKIELIGFKSFAEKTTFLIEDGLTGIVGPNGCGKSNIVEALRWCMGETSAKSMRGSEMEDVIFSGTSNRTSKNIAEVSLSLDNLDNEGPIQFKDIEKINKGIKIENINYNKIRIKIDKLDKTYTWIIAKLREGKNREIRNICKYFSWNIVKLIRIQYGPYKLGNLKEGKIEEIKVIKNA